MYSTIIIFNTKCFFCVVCVTLDQDGIQFITGYDFSLQICININLPLPSSSHCIQKSTSSRGARKRMFCARGQEIDH